ncbi:oxygenase MpaB family protein [Nocardioides ginsengisoli]|uniref:Oxygenase MpaB family protein n=1 Tax=Nocardioides ginsengisoli TaxID=363868 RepID=A0ABW3W653_9ACTN
MASYLMRLTTLQNFPRSLRLLAPFLVFVTTGFLPPLFREAMGLAWSPRKQRRFERLLPRPLRIFPFNLWLADMRLRRRLRRPLV